MAKTATDAPPRMLVSLLVALLALAGCDDGAQSEDIEPSDDQPAALAEDEGDSADDGEGAGAAVEETGDRAAADELAPVAETDSYRVAATASDEYASGELGQLGITISGRGKWHINQDFPTEVSLTPVDGVELPKETLAKGDAAELNEETARFDVPFTPDAPGEHRLEAEVRFAMCTPETCVPKTQKLAVLLPVK